MINLDSCRESAIKTRPLKIKEDEPNVQGDLSKDKSSMTKQNNKTES